MAEGICEDAMGDLEAAEAELAAAEAALEAAWEGWMREGALVLLACGAAIAELGANPFTDGACLYELEQELENKWDVELAQMEVEIAMEAVSEAQGALDSCLECYHAPE